MTEMKTMTFNPRGICGNCGQVGSFDWPGKIYLCKTCTSEEVVELLEAVRDTLEEFSEWKLDDTPLRRLDLAAQKLIGRRRVEAPIAQAWSGER